MEYDMGSVQLAGDGEDKRRKKKKSEIKKKAVKFTKIVSLVGLRHATDSRNSTHRRFIWVAWVVLGIGLAIYQIQECMVRYLEYPSRAKIQVETPEKLRFPQVTICPDNQIVATRARDKGSFTAIANVENTMQRLRVYEERGYEPHLTKQTRILLNEYVQILHDNTLDWFNLSKELAPTADVSIPIAYFNATKDRNIIDNFITDLGHCFAFGTKDKPLHTDKPGPLNGLNLILNAPRVEIIPNVRYLANSESFPGFRVFIHDPDDVPRMRQAGFSLRPKTITRVTVDLKNMSLLSAPYGNCDDHSNRTYKASRCRTECADRTFVKRCKCRENYMNYTDMLRDGVPYCSYGRIINCSHALLVSTNDANDDGGCSARCPKQCHHHIYAASVTKSSFPQVMSDEVKEAQGSASVEDLSQIIIYYPQLSYQEVESEEAYPASKLLCDVGNALSLLLGATLLTLYEASEFLVVFLSDYLRFRFSK